MTSRKRTTRKTECRLRMVRHITASMTRRRQDGGDDENAASIEISPSLHVQGEQVWDATITYTPTLDLTQEQLEDVLNAIFWNDVREEDFMDWHDREFHQEALDAAHASHGEHIRDIAFMLAQSPRPDFRQALRERAQRGDVTLRTPDAGITTVLTAGAILS